jgi:Ni/Co efflux regulator RcnB
VQALWHLEITVVGSAQWASGDTMNTWARSGYQVNEYGAERVHRPDNTENFH